jgi:hypothetical protein
LPDLKEILLLAITSPSAIIIEKTLNSRIAITTYLSKINKNK